MGYGKEGWNIITVLKTCEMSPARVKLYREDQDYRIAKKH